jgi:hypothetical protein
MRNVFMLDDGSSIQWVDKESLAYKENGFEVTVWVDFEPGFFSRGRILKLSSLGSWSKWPDTGSNVIGREKRDEIIEKVKKYYSAQNKPLRTE